MPADPRFPLFHGVPAHPTNFVGREEILDRLVARLTSGGNASVSAGGTGGAGKTTLAVKLAYDPRILAHFTEGVLWAALGKDPTIEAILADWASALGLDVSSIADPADRAKAIKNAVGLRSILFIIDDVWDEAATNVLRCGGPNCAHLLTTRDDGIARAFAGPTATEKVPELEPDPAFELLQRLAPEVCAAEPAAARALVRDVGGLPLAIELLGGYLGDPEHSGLSVLRTEALRVMSDPGRRLQLARERLGGQPGEKPTLEQTIALSLEDLPDEVVQAFYCLGAFAPKPASFELTAAVAVANGETWYFGVLLRRNLIESSDGERLSIHPVVVNFARRCIPVEAIDRHRDIYTMPSAIDEGHWQVIEREYGQIRHAWSAWEETSKSKIRFVLRIQGYQRLRGLWRDRINWAENAVVIAQNESWTGHLAALFAQLGLTYKDLGHLQRAIQYYESALSILEESEDRNGLAAMLTNMGVVYNILGQRQKALSHFERALPLRIETGDRKGLAATLNNIGSVYHARGQQVEALEYLERALSIRNELGDHQGLAVTMNNIGSVYRDLGQFEKALEYYGRALPFREEVGDRQGQAATLNNIGTVLGALGQQQEALEYYERALVIAENVGIRQGVATTLNNIGSAYNALEQPQKALAYYEQALQIRQEVGDLSGLATTLNNIGTALHDLKEFAQTIEFRERALSVLIRIDDRAGEAVTRYSLAGVYLREDRLSEAVEQLRQCVELGRALNSPELQKYRTALQKGEAALAAASTIGVHNASDSLQRRLKRLFRRGK